MRVGVRWFAAVLLGAGVFEGLDFLGSSPFVSQWVPGVEWLPMVSPVLAGAAAAVCAGPGIASSLVAAAGAVWGRIGLDRGLGALRGAHLPAEAGTMLLVAFGIPWTVMALAGGGVAALVRRLTAPRRA